MKTMSEKFEMYNKVFNSLLRIKEGPHEEAHEALKEASLIVGVSAGRMERTLDIPSAEFARNSNVTYINYNDIGFPADTIDLAATKFERRHKKIVGIFPSSSGETDSTNNTLERLSSYLQQNKNDIWEIILVTQNPNSTAGKIVKESNGIIIEMEGSENKDSKDYRRFGMMRDLGEYTHLWFGQTEYQSLIENEGPERFYEIIEDKMPIIGRRIDEWEESETCKSLVEESLVENLRRHCDVFAGGRKGAKDVSKFLIKRLGQVKQIIGDQAYLFGGENTPDPRAGDVVLLPSKSGGMEKFYSPVLKGEAYVLNWCKKAQEIGAVVYPFVGIENSPLEDLCGCEYTTLVDSASKGFSDTYAKIVTLQGTLPILLAERLDKSGFDVSPKNLKKKHGF